MGLRVLSGYMKSRPKVASGRLECITGVSVHKAKICSGATAVERYEKRGNIEEVEVAVTREVAIG